MMRPLRFLGEYLARPVGEYFLGTETSRWYSNQRVVAREHLPEDDNLNLHNSRLRKYLRSSYFEQAISLGVGRVVPDITLAASVMNFPDPKYINIFLFGEFLRVGQIIYNTLYRTPFIHSRYAKEEPEEWEPEFIERPEKWQNEGEGWKPNRPKTWEDEGEDWKN